MGGSSCGEEAVVVVASRVLVLIPTFGTAYWFSQGKETTPYVVLGQSGDPGKLGWGERQWIASTEPKFAALGIRVLWLGLLNCDCSVLTTTKPWPIRACAWPAILYLEHEYLVLRWPGTLSP